MSEFPGYLPWYLGGEEAYTYAEIDALVTEYNRRLKEQRRNKNRQDRPQPSPIARRRGRRR